jgi:predicted phosphodiesterase
MRIFALSDIHVDYQINARWIAGLSDTDYRDDVLILAGDVTDALHLLKWCLEKLTRCFRKVLFVPGNHDLWVIRDGSHRNSLQKFTEVLDVVESTGASMQPFFERGVLIAPFLAWYDYSFGEPDEELRSQWNDYHACRWPEGYDEARVAAHFAALNRQRHGPLPVDSAQKVITFSHFLPRIDVMPHYIPASKKFLYPVLGTAHLDRELRKLNPSMHVYGHSHVNRSVELDGVLYINNAFGYPNETRISSKRLLCIHEC